MSVFEDHSEELDHYETMMGPWRGRLAVTLDLMTNAIVVAGQHGVYCHSAREPEKPSLDIQTVLRELTQAKQLVQSVIEGLQAERERQGG
ncbi:MAG TPA: hypothetical protein VGS20_02140 [Candidatus Acidoferrales bacterium]|nr:hypothetical protein [Candidatus Acidoferrales bacterium]